MRKTRWLAAMLVLLFVTAGVRAESRGDPAAGEEKAGACGGCHGFDGNSETAEFPHLAGQYAQYIVKQVKDFQSGARANNETMAGMAAMVESEQDLQDIAAFYAQQKFTAKPLVSIDKKLAAIGEKLYIEGVPAKNIYGCVNCHGERGMGKAPNIGVFPVLGGQHRDYTIKQMKDFQTGGRNNDPAGMMVEIAKPMSDAQIEAIATYLSGQK